MREVVLVPTFHREELLSCCLKRLRGYDADIPIYVFPDRGTGDTLVRLICEDYEAHMHLVPDSDWYGNSANIMNAYLWAFNAGYDRVFMVESDVMIHEDFFSWHREQQEQFPQIFASMAWIFNREAPISDDLMFQPWIYSIGLCFSREKLALVAQHATPKYYGDMPAYLEKVFNASPLTDRFAIAHWEQDGLLQRILDKDKSQTVSSGIAKCSHVGFVRSYGDGTKEAYEKFLGLEGLRFDERVERVEKFIADPYARMDVFGRALVERELGYVIPVRRFTYHVTVPGGWSATFQSELKREFLGKRILSVPVTKETEIVLRLSPHRRNRAAVNNRLEAVRCQFIPQAVAATLRSHFFSLESPAMPSDQKI